MPGPRRLLSLTLPRVRIARSALLSAALLVLSACAGENVSGPPATPASLRVDSGNAQEGVVGQALPNPVAITVLDVGGRPIQDARVTFSLAPGGGTLTPSSMQTNSNGQAQAQWTLGTQTGTVVATANVTGVTSATFTATVRPGPAAQVVASPSTLALGLGDSLRLQATARDRFGNTVEQLALAWSTLDPAVISVTGGLVTALSQGTARAVVSTSGPSGQIADTVSISVGPAGSSFCGGREPVVPAIGAVVLLTNTAGGAERCVGANVAGAEYALVLINANPSFTATAALDALALGVGTAPAATVTAAFSVNVGAPAVAADFAPTLITSERDGGFERRLRTRERTELAPLVDAARARFGSSARSADAPGLYAQVTPPAVGSLLTLNAQALSACTQANNRTGRVVAVSQRAVIVADTANPTGGYTDAEYQDIAAAFDTVTYPLDVEYFGEPTNVSGFNRIILFYSRVVNQLTPQGANFIVGGFFFSRDLFPRAAANGLPGCAASNEKEMMYLLVADPNGAINGNRRSKADVTRLNRTTVAHELQHLINSGRRLYVTPNATANEAVWLDEGLAHTAEELLYFRLAGFTSRQNLSLADVAPNETAAQLFSDYAAQNFARWTGYLRAPESNSPYAPNDSLATRGAAWHFLRYAAGRQPQNEAAFYRQLVSGPRTGVDNLANAIPGNALTEWLRDWAVANFADDLATGLAAQYTVPAWNFRSILPALRVGGTPLGAYPLATRSLPSNTARRVTLAGGGSGYLRFTVPAARRALLAVTFNGQAPPTNVQLAIVRYR